MRIYIRTDEGKKFWIPLPMWMIRLGLSSATIRIATKNLREENKKYIEQIDFRALSQNIKELKKYKGLKIVDIKSKDGTKVTITV
ncbi:MAG: hypothetical protein K0R09_2187 [Clostridiales bacterium]|jgi:hypothetical protein|nr:hypothetical protein [Clostridiales bacterium]